MVTGIFQTEKKGKMSELGEGEEQVGSYAIYFAEGETLAKQKEFKKAVESFTKALEFQPEDKPCLVARSKCYLQLGDATTALQDAEASLKEDKNYHRGLLQKAEALYATGDFEYSLVFFHRGHKIRPDLHEFTLGIEKCQEAINNSIGTPDACTLEKVGDLSYFHQQDIMNKKKAMKLQKPALKAAAAQMKAKVERKPVASEKTVKELLGELYADKEYLEKLLKDPGLATKQKDRSIQETVESALTYLDQRTEFWRQQKPMYARKREKEMKRYKPSPTRFITISKSRGNGPDQVKLVMKTLEEIDAALQGGDAEGSLAQAEKALQMVLASNDRELPNKAEFVSSLHACIGNAQLELGNSEAAIQNFHEDLKITQECNLGIAKSRALDNLARVYTVLGDFEKAIPLYAAATGL